MTDRRSQKIGRVLRKMFRYDAAARPAKKQQTAPLSKLYRPRTRFPKVKTGEESEKERSDLQVSTLCDPRRLELLQSSHNSSGGSDTPCNSFHARKGKKEKKPKKKKKKRGRCSVEIGNLEGGPGLIKAENCPKPRIAASSGNTS